MAGKRKKNDGGKAGTSRGLFPILLLSWGLLICAVILQVGLQIHMKQINYAMAGESKRRDLLLEENKRLKVERETLRSAGRIENLARERLNMDYPARDQIIFVK